MEQEFKALGKRVKGALTAEGLETFPVPAEVTKVKFVTKELTAFCPVTDQPDLYTAEIDYEPRDVVVESKTLKLYLNGFRDTGIFGETLAYTIAKDLNGVLQPQWVRVRLIQQVRGGLEMTAEAMFTEGGN